jgi:addiction module HigA family antidote
MAIAKANTASVSTTSGASASASKRAPRSRSKSSTITRLLPRGRPPTHPGEMLLEEFLIPSGISQAELARRLGKTAAAINELVKGKRGVSAEMALMLADLFGTTAEFWMNLQVAWELWHARRRLRLV